MGKDKPSFRIAAVTVACTDLAHSSHFYEEVLGAARETGDGFGCPRFKLGSVSISLLNNATEANQSIFPDHAMAMLWLETHDLVTTEAHCTKAGVTILSPSDGQSMMIADPDGIVIEIWQAEVTV
jgi:catechol 2,3-dioxygenase-like lactoylglutathione lyase family enzyme